MGEMFQTALYLLRAIKIRTANRNLTLVLHYSSPAYRTMRRRMNPLLITGALGDIHTDDGRNDFPCLLDDDEITHADVFALDLLKVMQRGIAHGAAAQEHRLQACNRRERSSAANLDIDGEQARLRLFRLVFVGDGPARGFARRAEIALLREGIHLDDRAIGFIGKLLSLHVEIANGFDDFIGRVAMPNEIGLGQFRIF